jgi:hypothetical protein
VIRRLVRRDANHAAIVATLRAAGVLVHDAAALGSGFPDLVCAHPRVGVRLVEVKRPAGPRGGTSDRELRPAQVAFHRAWQRYACVVTSPEEALAALGLTVEARAAHAAP